jgi:hypothetical protein
VELKIPAEVGVPLITPPEPRLSRVHVLLPLTAPLQMNVDWVPLVKFEPVAERFASCGALLVTIDDGEKAMKLRGAWA